MANKKKNKKKAPQKAAPQNMTPRQYIQSGRARTLEILECLVSADWQESGMSTVIVARQHKTGNITWGTYLLDIFCLGVKDTSATFNRFEDDYEAYKNHIARIHPVMLPIDYDMAHNLVFGAAAYAATLGFKPQKDWADSQFILLPANSPEVEKIDIEFGKDGQPFYISGPYDNVGKITAQLNAAVGEGNYTFLANMGGFSDSMFSNDDFDDDDDDDFDDDDDDDFDDNDTQDIDYEEVK